MLLVSLPLTLGAEGDSYPVPETMLDTCTHVSTHARTNLHTHVENQGSLSHFVPTVGHRAEVGACHYLRNRVNFTCSTSCYLIVQMRKLAIE